MSLSLHSPYPSNPINHNTNQPTHTHSSLPSTNSLKYNVHKIDGAKLEQKEPWFLAINPNGRIPALTDTLPSGQKISLFESGAILLYLTNTYDPGYEISYPINSAEWHETNAWLFFQMAGVGPMQGQSNHFLRYAPERIEYAIDRFREETRRLYRVLDLRLAEQEKRISEGGEGGYLVGNGEKCTIADIAHWGWICLGLWAGVDLREFPALERWEERMAQRPGVEMGRHIPERHVHKEILKDEKKMKELEERGKKFAAKSTEFTREVGR